MIEQQATAYSLITVIRLSLTPPLLAHQYAMAHLLYLELGGGERRDRGLPLVEHDMKNVTEPIHPGEILADELEAA